MNNLSPSFAYCASQAADKIGVPQDATMDRACIDLMCAIIREDLGITIENPIKLNQETEKQTIAWMQSTYNFHATFTPDFCKHFQNIDYDALSVAMLCRGYTDRTNLIAKQSPITPDVIRRADAILEEAQSLYNKVLGYDQNFDGKDDIAKEPSIESVYITHMLLAHEIYSIFENDYSDFDKESFEILKDGTLAPARAFALGYTRLGSEMIQNIDHIEGYLRAIALPEEYPVHEEPSAPPKQRPRLTVIENAQFIPS